LRAFVCLILGVVLPVTLVVGVWGPQFFHLAPGGTVLIRLLAGVGIVSSLIVLTLWLRARCVKDRQEGAIVEGYVWVLGALSISVLAGMFIVP
jgi:hypothetical protein